jgi:hypothetical protein
LITTAQKGICAALGVEEDDFIRTAMSVAAEASGRQPSVAELRRTICEAMQLTEHALRNTSEQDREAELMQVHASVSAHDICRNLGVGYVDWLLTEYRERIEAGESMKRL